MKKKKTYMKNIVLAFAFICIQQVIAQTYPIPKTMGSEHPRILTRGVQVDEIQHLTKEKEWAQRIINERIDRLQPILNHLKTDKDWLRSRLQMYWNSKATQVYINGGVFHHTEGTAPLPTVKYPGTRNHTTDYIRPKLEDVQPFMDNEKGLYLQHKSRPDSWEWASISKTGKIIESINREILSIAKDASFLYWYTGKKIYAELAYGILDTYLTGIYYREIPIDISHGHHQTLVGYSSFEVIQEHILDDITVGYDFLHQYIQKNHTDKIALFDATLQKWADLIIQNGVSFNNWNLLQAAHISKIALVLEDNKHYKNRKGGPYYLDQIMNQTSTRQWSMKKLMDYGYDAKTGIWNESPGYSMNVLNDFIHFSEFYDRNFNIDLIEEIPVLKLAVKSAAEYLYPNKFMVAFGDGHYNHLSSEPIKYLIENAKKYHKKEDEVFFTKMYKTIYGEEKNHGEFVGNHIEDLFSQHVFELDNNSSATQLSDFTSPLFYAPNTSWLVQRQGTDENDALMISEIGSFGNHMHSNGIAMELYGKGLPLAPEMGHGSSYFSIEYAEYYTQFPAHNTVIVNGKSKYPEMKSNHAFKVLANYPESGKKEGNLNRITFSDVSFLEPETQSLQRRTMGIVKNKKGGFYVDVFRSKQQENNDVKHEYFYHNLGQKLTLTNANNKALDLKETSALAFGDGDLMAYDYMWNKKSVVTNDDFKGQFSLQLKDREVNMNLWFQGNEDREIFSVMSPKSTAFRHGPLPKELNDAPIPTLVVKQHGEAWNRPFVVIYEPAENETSNIQSVDYFGERTNVGIAVTQKSGEKHFIFSTTDDNTFLTKEKYSLTGSYGVISLLNDDFTLFLGSGKSISNSFYSLEVLGNQPATAILKKQEHKWFIETESTTVLKVKVFKKVKKSFVIDAKGTKHKGTYHKKTKEVYFELPALAYQNIKMEMN